MTTYKRQFEPAVITTKHELQLALQKGEIKSSKYNLLNKDQKLFVEMIVFGGFSAQEAIKEIRPKAKSFKALANRWIALPNVAAVLEELSTSKDKKFMAEISNARDLALGKLTFIMNTTEDEGLAATCAKTILDKAEKAIANKDKEDNAITGMKFALELAREVNKSKEYQEDERVILQADDPIVEDFQTGPNDKGLSYNLSYETVDNYSE